MLSVAKHLTAEQGGEVLRCAQDDTVVALIFRVVEYKERAHGPAGRIEQCAIDLLKICQRWANGQVTKRHLPEPWV